MACHQELRTSGRASGTMFMELGDEARTLGPSAMVGIGLDYEIISGKKGAGREVRTNSASTGNTQGNAQLGCRWKELGLVEFLHFISTAYS